MESTTPVVKLDRVCKRYGNVSAMNNVSFEIPPGHVFALLGENGAGKTTTIRSILGLETPDSGLIQVLGMNPGADGIAIRRQLGYVPDSPKLYEWMTVSQIAWFSAGFYPDGFISNFEKIAAELELPTSAKIKTLSKGGKAKVALALSMAHRPDLLILDEPTSGLDTLVRRKFLESMVDVAGEGRTVLLSSHQIPEVERVADYVAIVNHGQIRVCEKLDILKQEMEQWVVTLANPNVALPSMAKCSLHHEGLGRKRQLITVRAPDPNKLWELRDTEGVVDVEVHTPSLEEIFVAYLQSSPIDKSPIHAKLEPPVKRTEDQPRDVKEV